MHDDARKLLYGVGASLALAVMYLSGFNSLTTTNTLLIGLIVVLWSTNHSR
jgi:hypothetical protein